MVLTTDFQPASGCDLTNSAVFAAQEALPGDRRVLVPSSRQPNGWRIGCG